MSLTVSHNQVALKPVQTQQPTVKAPSPKDETVVTKTKDTQVVYDAKTLEGILEFGSALPFKLLDTLTKSFLTTVPDDIRGDFQALVSDKTMSQLLESLTSYVGSHQVTSEEFFQNLPGIVHDLLGNSAIAMLQGDMLSDAEANLTKLVKKELEKSLPAQASSEDIANALKQKKQDLQNKIMEKLTNFTEGAMSFHENQALTSNLIMASASARQASLVKSSSNDDDDDSIDLIDTDYNGNESFHATQFAVSNSGSDQGDSSSDDDGYDSDDDDLESLNLNTKSAPSTYVAPAPFSYVTALNMSTGDVNAILAILFLQNAQLIEKQLGYQINAFQEQNAKLQDLNNILLQLSALPKDKDGNVNLNDANKFTITGLPDSPDNGDSVSLEQALIDYGYLKSGDAPGGKITGDKRDVLVNVVKSNIEQTNSLSQMQMSQIQDTNNKRSTAYDASASLVKKWGDLSSRIVQNF